jgi:drug/metabolite transporter (DMT)-like permease
MTAGVIFIVLGAAFLHAAWNALLRSGADRFWSIVVMGVASASVALPLTFMLAPPARASWPYIGLSAFLQICYCLVLVRAYREGELGSIYPIARGSSPMLVTLGALVFAGEKLGPLALFGVAMVSCGIIGMTFGRGRPNVSSIVAALATGLFIASYTVADGIGSRLSGYPQSYAAWLFLFQGAPMPLVYFAMRGKLAIDPFGLETLKAAGAGIMSLLGYGAIIWALSLSPMGQVSALRETSILFAVLMGRIFLGETLTLNRVVAGVTIAIGAICLAGASPCTHGRSPAPLSPAFFVCVMVSEERVGERFCVD